MKTSQVPEYIRTIKPYIPGKPIEETQRELNLSQVIKLASNENPLGSSPLALEAMKEHVLDLHRYPDGACFHLKQALSQKLGITPASLTLGNGSNEVITHLVRTYCVPGDAIVCPQYSFIAYQISAQTQGVKTLTAPVNDQLKPNPHQILELIRKEPRVKLVFIANPNNPTGTYLDRQEMSDLLDGLQTIRDGSVLAALDYAYWEYVTVPDLPAPQELLQKYTNLMVLRTFSKVYGLAGVRVGYGVSDPEMISHLEKVREPFNINSIGLVAAEAALSDSQFVDQSKRMNEKGMKFWENQLTQHSIPFWKSQGNFVLVDTMEGLGKTGTEIFQECLKKGVIFRPLANYGLPNALRITIGTQEENEIAFSSLSAIQKPK